MILVFGSINVDLVARVATIPGPGKTVLAPAYEQHFGGKGANQAIAAARLAAPGSVTLAACVGADSFGREAADNLTGNGIATELLRTIKSPTGCAFITVDAQAENAITVASGANLLARADDVPEALLSDATTLVLQMEVPFEQSLTLARRTRRAGGKVIWNCAPVPAGFEAADAAALLATSDLLIVNEHEAADIAVALGESPNASSLVRNASTICIVTAGAKGALAYFHGGAAIHVPALLIKPVDTTGAGDTFVGAVAVALDEGFSVLDALDFGCRAAAKSCLAVGAQAGMPFRDSM